MPPQQGWQQPPPGYGYPPGPPRKKSKAPLIISLAVVGLLVLGAAITAVVMYLSANSDRGVAKRGGELPALCGNISAATLAKARNTNPNNASSSELDLPYGKRTICTWDQTLGVDGGGMRNTSVYVTREAKDAKGDYQRVVQQAMANEQGEPRQKPLDGLGDEATAILVETKSSFSTITIAARKGDTVVELHYWGWDAGLFTSKRPDPATLEATAKEMAEEMLAKL